MFLKAYSLSTQKVHGGTYQPSKPVFSFWDSNPIPMWQVTVTSRLSDEESRTVRTRAGSGCAGVTTGEDMLPQSSWGGHSSPRTPLPSPLLFPRLIVLITALWEHHTAS